MRKYRDTDTVRDIADAIVQLHRIVNDNDMPKPRRDAARARAYRLELALQLESRAILERCQMSHAELAELYGAQRLPLEVSN